MDKDTHTHEHELTSLPFFWERNKIEHPTATLEHRPPSEGVAAPAPGYTEVPPSTVVGDGGNAILYYDRRNNEGTRVA